MKWYTNPRNLRKYFALTAIYLIISLTFITAQALAILNYDVSGDADVSGFARANGDIIKINVDADSNVSFAVGQNTASYAEVPLDGCITDNVTGKVHCLYYFQSSDINTNIQNIPFVLKQPIGDPLTKSGNLYIDSMVPQVQNFVPVKDGNGINFTYSLTDYLASTSEDSVNHCIGSGIGYIEIDVQGRPVFTEDIPTQNCTVSGNYYVNFKNTYSEKILYGLVVRDRAGNEYRLKPVEMSGDFRAPEISNTFQIIQNQTSNELISFSSMAQVQADVVVHIEDSSLNVSNVYGDLSDLNLNTAVNTPYKNIQAECARESGNMFRCVFNGIKLKPNTAELSIAITATDDDGNIATKTIKKTIQLKDSAGQLLYVGPFKNHCTDDLTQCYMKSGRQFIEAELDATSNYSSRVINLGVDSDKIGAVCKLTTVWTCIGIYDILKDTQSINVFVAESYDDFGNMLPSNVERRVIIDDAQPSLTGITSTNSNNNNNCSIAGDTLTFNITAKEDSPGLKVYVNTSAFTTKDLQKGQCTNVGGNNWECTLAIKDFASTPTSVTQDIILEDLAGNKFPIKHKFDVCKGISTGVPNVIYKVYLDGDAPQVDRRTASKISVKTYVPVTIDIQNGATLMYINIDRCVAPGMNGLDVMGTGHYFMPSYGKKSTLVLYIGNNGAQLPEKSLDINCTMTARVKVGSTVFLQEEKQDFTISVNTYNNPLGTVDDATNVEINNVKVRLRQVDSYLKTLTALDKILGTICQIAEAAGVANSIMQAVKAYIWGTLVSIGSVFSTATAGAGTPVAAASVQGVWSGVQGTLGAMHNFIGTFIWPPGYVPVPTAAVGFGVKYMCMAYTCKEYDFSTIVGIAMDISATGVGKNNQGAGITSTDKQGNVIQNTYEGNAPTSHAGISVSGPDEFVKSEVDAQSKLNNVGWSKGTQTIVTLSDKPTTYGTRDIVVTKIDKVLSPAQKVQIQAGTDALVNGLNGRQWIINPYKSVYYDDICVPAIIYNLKKEKQIDCMYVSCMQNQAANGVPKIFCDGNYQVNKCLYLDSAEYIVHNKNLWLVILNGFGDVFKNNALGLAIQTIYAVLCKAYYVPGGYLKHMLFWNAINSVSCGLAGSYFTVKEIADLFNSPLFKSRNMNPADKKDYCQGVDYSEESQVGVNSYEYG